MSLHTILLAAVLAASVAKSSAFAFSPLAGPLNALQRKWAAQPAFPSRQCGGFESACARSAPWTVSLQMGPRRLDHSSFSLMDPSNVEMVSLNERMNLVRTHTRPSKIVQQVWVGNRGEDATGFEDESALASSEKKLLRKLRERMAERNSPKSKAKGHKSEHQSRMEQERLREKLALRGKTSPPLDMGDIEVRSNIVKHNRRPKAGARGRAVRPAFKHQRRNSSPTSSPVATREHPEWSTSSAGAPSMPRSLSSFNNLAELVDVLEPVLASSADISAEDAVGAMNRVRRLAKRGMDSGLYGRQAALMRKLSTVVLKRMDTMQGKLLSLAVNAVAEMKGNDSWMEAAAKRAISVVTEGKQSGMDMQAVAVTLNGFARAGIRDEELFSVLGAEACRKASEDPEAFGSQSVSVIVNAFAKLRVTDSELFERMAGVAMLIPPEEFSAQSVANILNAYARNEEMHEPLMVYMSAVVRALEPAQYQARHLAVSVNAYAKLNVVDGALLAYLQGAILGRPPSAFDAQAIANILNGFAKLQGEEVSAVLLEHMSAAIVRTPLKYFDPTSLASMLNALVKTQYVDAEEPWRKLAEVARKIDPLLFDGQAVSTVLHAFAKADRFDRALFDRLALTVGEMQFVLEAQSVALILNACAKVDYRNPALLKHLSLVARQLPRDSFSAQHVDNVVNCLARLGVKDRALFEHMATVALELPPREFDAQAVAVTMNAFAKNMGQERVAHDVFAFFSADVLPELPAAELSPTSVSVMLNALAKTEIRDMRMVRQLCRTMLGDGPAGLDHFDARNIASVLHALATLHVTEPEIVQRLLRRLIREDAATMAAEEVAIIAWSTAVLDVHDAAVIDWLLRGLSVHLPDMDDNFRRQAHQFVLACELDGVISGVDELRAKLQSSQDHGVVTHSRLQKDVARVLAEMGLEFLEEYVDERSGYSLDVLMSDRVTAIEVDGPSHYARGTHTPLGNTLMKHRHLSNLGFDVRVLPYWEWDELKSKEQKKEYLRQLLTSTPTMIFL